MIDRLKLCNKCGMEKSTNAFYRRKSARDGLFTICKDCHNAYNNIDRVRLKRLEAGRVYRCRPDVKKARSSRMKGYRTDNILVFRAREMFQKRVQRGTIKRLPCSFCGNSRSEGHHPDHSKPLQIVWVCNSCHNDIHNMKTPEHEIMDRVVNYA